ncbi:MAG: nucleotidyltransferase family protein [Anaerolineaceae bacterium]|nr:nucleotidyltransferase family protein [Anaerolineaceae bacterium]
MNEASALKVPGVILAAGEARRFGKVKQLMPWDKFTVLESVIHAAIIAGLSPVLVVLGANREPIQEVARKWPAEILINDEWQEGQGTSLSLAARNLKDDIEGFVALLGDQPQMTPVLIRAIAAAGLSCQKIVRPLMGDRRGHPVYFPKACIDMLRSLGPGQSGRDVVRAFPNHLLPWLDGRMALDMDTLEDYYVLRSLFELDDKGFKPL